ncbi:MAG: dipeptide epimerase, partial [Lewinellaceae bacterium]|nr:dipeptide epimerase [Lewinellaceae bacterium]
MALTLHLHPYDLALRHTFRIAHGSRDIQPTVIVELRDGNLSGFGEAAAIRYYGQNQQEMMARLESWRDLIEQTPLTTPEAYWEALYPTMQQHPFLLCALDEAAHD